MNDETFKPAWWLPNSHLQTIWPVIVRGDIKTLQIERERLELPDGDFVDLDWVGKNDEGPLVLILHGFEGSIESHYAKGMLCALRKENWRGVFMHFRGCSGEPNRLPRSYHSGETRDIASVVNYLYQREPNVKLASIGYSLGGNILLKWMGETGKYNPLIAAIAISVPYDLHQAAARVQMGFSRFYQWYFLKCLRDRLMHKFQYVPSPIDPAALKEARTLRDFDKAYTAPLHGFSSVEEYYDIASSRRYLKNITVPTLLVHAKDDPFMTEQVIPDANDLSPFVHLDLSERGGHVGFVSGRYPWRPEYWLEKRVPAFLQEYLR